MKNLLIFWLTALRFTFVCFLESYIVKYKELKALNDWLNSLYQLHYYRASYKNLLDITLSK